MPGRRPPRRPIQVPTVSGSVSSHLASLGRQPGCAGRVANSGGGGRRWYPRGSRRPPQAGGVQAGAGPSVQAQQKAQLPPGLTPWRGTFGGDSRLPERGLPTRAAVLDGKFLPPAAWGAAKGTARALPREPAVETMCGGDVVGSAPSPRTRSGRGPSVGGSPLGSAGVRGRDRLREDGPGPARDTVRPSPRGWRGKARLISCGRRITSAALFVSPRLSWKPGRCRSQWSRARR